MDLKKIFLKDACPTPIGGQAVIDGVMMRGLDRTAIAVRTPDDRIYLKTMKNPKQSKWQKLPLIRGIVSFVMSLVNGMKIMTYSADVQQALMGEGEEEPTVFEKKLIEKYGEQKVWSVLMGLSVAVAVVIAIAVFVLFPTWAVSLLGKFISSSILLNLIEGCLRIALFVIYILLISKMEDIKKVFQYHGAEHKTIHCFENGEELIPEKATEFYRLHPRCGTSFLMFVMVISLILFSLLGWPGLALRIVSRLVMIPVVAALSYELLRWAGRSDNKIVEILSVPGLLLQKITTNEPTLKQLEIAIVSMKAVLVPENAPTVEGYCDKDANLIESISLAEMKGGTCE